MGTGESMITLFVKMFTFVLYFEEWRGNSKVHDKTQSSSVLLLYNSSQGGVAVKTYNTHLTVDAF